MSWCTSEFDFNLPLFSHFVFSFTFPAPARGPAPAARGQREQVPLYGSTLTIDFGVGMVFVPAANAASAGGYASAPANNILIFNSFSVESKYHHAPRVSSRAQRRQYMRQEKR